MEQIIIRDKYGCKRYEVHLGEGVLKAFDYTLRRVLGKLETIEFCKNELLKPFL